MKMTYTFYIGALSMILETEEELTLQRFDGAFLQPVLPVERSIMVRLQICGSLDIPAWEPIQVRGMRIWQKPGEEIRLYDGLRTKDSILSRYDGKDSVLISITEEAWEKEKRGFQPWYYIHVEELLLETHALLLHSASIVYRNHAILFTAPSGTGKTTQTDLWHRWREGVTDLNGDRNVLQKTEEGWFACGFPVYGGSNRCEQKAAPIEAIVIIRQSPCDEIHELTAMEKTALLYSEMTVMSAKRENAETGISMVMELASQVRIIQFNCTMNENAVDVLHRYLYGE